MAQGNGTSLDDADGLSREGRQALDQALGHLSPVEREAYWASIRKCFNAPYEAKAGAGPVVIGASGIGGVDGPAAAADLAQIAQPLATEAPGP